MQELQMDELLLIDGGKGIGRAIEAVAGSVGIGNAIVIGVIGGPWVGVGVAAVGAAALIDACL